MKEKIELIKRGSIEDDIDTVIKYIRKAQKKEQRYQDIIKYLEGYRNGNDTLRDLIDYIQIHVKSNCDDEEFFQLLNDIRTYYERLPLEDHIMEMIRYFGSDQDLDIKQRAAVEIIQFYRQHTIPIEGSADQIINHIIRYNQKLNFNETIGEIIRYLEEYCSPYTPDVQSIIRYFQEFYQELPFHREAEQFVDYLCKYFNDFDVESYFAGEVCIQNRLFYKNDDIDGLFTDEIAQKFIKIIKLVDTIVRDSNLAYLRKIINYYFSAIEESESWTSFVREKNIDLFHQNEIKWAFFYKVLSALELNPSFNKEVSKMFMTIQFITQVGPIVVNHEDNNLVRSSLSSKCTDRINISGKYQSSIHEKKGTLNIYGVMDLDLSTYQNEKSDHKKKKKHGSQAKGSRSARNRKKRQDDIFIKNAKVLKKNPSKSNTFRFFTKNKYRTDKNSNDSNSQNFSM